MGDVNVNKKLIFVIVVLSLLLLTAGFFYVKENKYFKRNNGEQIQNQSEVESKESRERKTEERIEKTVAEKTDFVGVVSGFQKPKDNAVVFLDVDASLIDKDKIKELDYSSGSTEMPMIKKKFKVAVDGSTKLNVDSLDKIQLGDLVSVVSPKSVYETDYFTAVTLDILPKKAE